MKINTFFMAFCLEVFLSAIMTELTDLNYSLLIN